MAEQSNQSIIWTAADWSAAIAVARVKHDGVAIGLLNEHAPLLSHCRNYELLAWPCPTAAHVLNTLQEAYGLR